MILAGRSRRLRYRPIKGAAASLLVALTFGAALQAGPTTASSACTTTTASTGYTIQTCLSPASGSVSGDATVSLAVTLSSSTVRPSYVVFCLDGTLTSSPSCTAGGAGYLLRDFRAKSQPTQTQSVWSFSLASAHWIDGSHSLLGQVAMRDGTLTKPVSTNLSFSNGNRSQPINSASPQISTGTKPAPGAPLLVAAVGDGAAGDPTSKTIATMVSGWQPNLFLYLGDVYQDGSYLEFSNWYDGRFGSLRSITDPVPGNHEYVSHDDPAASSSAAGVAYFDYWNNLPHYYSLNAGGWHFIALDANSSGMGGTAWKAELSWLSNDLSSHSGMCTLAYWHQPAFNIGSEPVPGSATTLWQAVAGKATLVLNGHDHTYQRWTAMTASGSTSSAGTVELIDGTGGHAAGSFTKTDSRVLASSKAPGALHIALGSSSAALEFLSSSGSVLDHTTVPCL